MSWQESLQVFHTAELAGRALFYDYFLLKPLVRINQQHPQSPIRYQWRYSDSVVLTLWCDVVGINYFQINKLADLLKLYKAFKLMWRIPDNVIDQHHILSDVTPTEAKFSKVESAFGQEISVKDVQTLFIDAVHRLLPVSGENKQTPWSKVYREVISFRQEALQAINDPKFRSGEILPFPLAYELRDKTAGLLAETSSRIYARALGLPDSWELNQIHKLCRCSGLAMQFGDDLLDWREDWLQRLHQARVKPLENLFISTLAEFTTEKGAIRSHIGEADRAYELVEKYAPNTLTEYHARFENQLAKFPQTVKTAQVQHLFRGVFYRLVPRLPRDFASGH